MLVHCTLWPASCNWSVGRKEVKNRRCGDSKSKGLFLTRPGSAGCMLLPLELWVNVFSLLNVNSGGDLKSLAHRPDIIGADQRSFLQLQLVCRKFRAVFKTHPGIASAVVLDQELADSDWSSFFAWTRGRTASIDTLITNCSRSQLNIALAGLGGQQVALKTAVLRQCSVCSIHLLSSFSTLKSCALSSVSNVNLSPLEMLPALCCLELYSGSFHCTKLPPSLLTLSIDDSSCHIFAVGSCLEKLQQLTVSASQLCLVPTGIAACTALQSLHCLSSVIRSDEAECRLVTGQDFAFHLPAVLSSLTCLTKVVMIHNGSSQGALDLTNIYALRSLRSLDLLSSTSSVSVNHGLTALMHLAMFRLNVSNKERASEFDDVDDGADPDLELKLDVDWAALTNLQDITIRADVFRCRTNLMKLAEINSLRTVGFICSKPGDTSSSTCFASLAYTLAKCRPHVCLRLDGMDMSN